MKVYKIEIQKVLEVREVSAYKVATCVINFVVPTDNINKEYHTLVCKIFVNDSFLDKAQNPDFTIKEGDLQMSCNEGKNKDNEVRYYNDIIFRPWKY